MKSHTFLASLALTLASSITTLQAAPPDQPGHTAPEPGTKSEAVSATKDKLGHAIGVISAEMTTTTAGFVAAAATSDIYEIDAAKIASTRAQSSKVKEFAATMASAHKKTTRELQSIITDEQLGVTPPTTLDTRRQAMIDDLRGAKDTDFDERYISQQVDAHEEALILTRGYHGSGDNAALKKFAGNVENAVKMHLSMARRLDKRLEVAEEKNEKH